MDSGTNYWIENEWSWNNFANVLYIESPPGVGYSYCKGVADCTFTDEKSAEVNLQAVLQWFTSFPEFKTNDLYISGESYAGIYVPYLTWEMDQYIIANQNVTDAFIPNLKGFAVGNGCTSWDYDTTGAYVEMGYWHSLISTDLWE